MTVTATVRVTVRVGDSEGGRGWATAGVTVSVGDSGGDSKV